MENASLFNEVAPTEGQLRGEEGAAATSEAKPAGVDFMLSEKPTDREAGAETTGTEGTGAQGAKELEVLQADSKRLTEEIENLRRELKESKQGKPADKTDDGDEESADTDKFKVLTDEEYEALLEDDPTEALRYVHALRSHEKSQAEKRAALSSEQNAAMSVAGDINAAIPGLYAQDSPIAKALVEHATAAGMNRDVLDFLTNPASKLMMEGKAVPLGDIARQVTLLVASSYEGASGEKIRASSKKATTKQPASRDKEPVETFDIATKAEKELATMSEEETRKYLGG
jgi:hypothetical protein